MKKQKKANAINFAVLIIVISLILVPISSGLCIQKQNEILDLSSSDGEDFIITIHRLRLEDEIDPLPHSGPGEWTLFMYINDEEKQYEFSGDDLFIDKSFIWQGIVSEGMKYVEVRMQLLEKDLGYWPDDHDLADISAKVDENYQQGDYDDTTDFNANRPVVFKRMYDVNNKAWAEVDANNDFLQTYEDELLNWFITSGNYDGSNAIDQNDVSIWFNINVGNTPPYTPEKPMGTNLGWIGEVYSYTTQSFDPDGDRIKFGWDWDGDDVIDEITGYYDSWEIAESFTGWLLPRIFYIKVCAIDERGLSSGWSEEFKVEINGPYGKTGTEVNDWSLGFVISNYYDHYQTQEILNIIRSGGNIVTALATLISAIAAAAGVPLDISISVTIVTALLRLGVEVISLMDRGMGIYTRIFIVMAGEVPITSIGYAWSQSSLGGEGKEPIDNVAPNIPTISIDTDSIKPGEEISITMLSAEKNSDEISYLIEWGDGNQTFTDFTEDNVEVTSSHVYENNGYYIARIKAIDPYGQTSEWSESINIIVENSRQKQVFYKTFFSKFPQLFQNIISI